MTTIECPRCGARFQTKQQLYVIRETVKPKRGRPPIVGPRPWEQEGISRRTWYRKRKAAKA